MFIFYLWERGRGQAEREGDTESELGSRLWVVSTEPDVGLELTDSEIVTWAEVGRSTDWATQGPLNFHFIFLFKKNFFLTFIYFWDRERQSMNGGGSERGRHRIWNRLQALSSQHRARRGARTHKLQDHNLSRRQTLNLVSHPSTLRIFFLNAISCILKLSLFHSGFPPFARLLLSTMLPYLVNIF